MWVTFEVLNDDKFNEEERQLKNIQHMWVTFEVSNLVKSMDEELHK